MKKRNIIKTLGGAITLLIFLFCFLAACEEDGYQASIRGIKFCEYVQAFDEDDEPVYKEDGITPVFIYVEIDDSFTVTTTPKTLYVIVDKPSSIKDTLVDVTVSVTPSEIITVVHLDNLKHELTVPSPVTSGTYFISVTAEPGGLNKTYNVIVP